jgi:hypothetical protein
MADCVIFNSFAAAVMLPVSATVIKTSGARSKSIFAGVGPDPPARQANGRAKRPSFVAHDW